MGNSLGQPLGGAKLAANPVDGASPGGAASGDLAGTYPSPRVAQASGSFALTGIVAVTISSTVNNWDPFIAQVNGGSTVLLTVSGGTQGITGMVGGTSGRLVFVANVSANIAVISDESGSSLAANRFSLGGASLLLQPGQSQVFSYNATAQRWGILGANPATLFQLNQNNTVLGSATFAGGASFTYNAVGGFYRQDVINPANITGNVNNWDPDAGSTANIASNIRATANAGPFNVTGLVAAAQNGQECTVFNIGTNAFVLTNEDGASTAANRFAFGANITVNAGGSVSLRYDGTSSRWRCIGSFRVT